MFFESTLNKQCCMIKLVTLICCFVLFSSYESIAVKKHKLTIIISAKNHCFYYEDDIRINEKENNFMSSSPKTMKYTIASLKTQYGSKQLYIVLKVEKMVDLNEDAKKLIKYIKNQKHHDVAPVTEYELELVHTSEK